MELLQIGELIGLQLRLAAVRVFFVPMVAKRDDPSNVDRDSPIISEKSPIPTNSDGLSFEFSALQWLVSACPDAEFR